MREVNLQVKDSNRLVKIDLGGEVHQVFLNGVLQRHGKNHDYLLPRFGRGIRFNHNLDVGGLVTAFVY